jgi:hypothetical protein
LTLPPDPGVRIGRKPIAVAAAVEQASGEIVLTTDADCTHHPRWLRTMVAAFSPSTALVAGPVALRAHPSFFGQLEHLDFFGWVTASAGLIGAGRPIICNGANLAYRRDAYRAAQSEVQVSSSDDGTLLSRIVTRRLGAVGYASHPDAVVTAGAADSLSAFFRQRRRWAAVRGRFLDTTIYVELVLLFCFFCSLLTLAIVSIIDTEWLPLLAFVASMKFLVDGTAISIAGRRWKIPWSVGPFLVAELLQPMAIVAASVISLRVPFVWKGRRLQR